MEQNIFDVTYESGPQSTEEEKYLNDLIIWLKDAPRYTTFRVNLLKSNGERLIRAVECHLKNQMEECSQKTLPQICSLFSDTVVVDKWPEKNERDDGCEQPEVIVDASCGSSVLRGSHVFAPGVMGLSPDVKLNDKVSIYADVNGQCKKGLKVKFADEKKRFVGIGQLKMQRHELFKENEKPTGIAIRTISSVSQIPILNSNILPFGECLLQNLPSIICSKVLNPQSGEIILDMCAAPGNKTSHIAEIINNKGTIIALDKSESKIHQIKKICEEHAITCVFPYVHDSTKIVNENLKAYDTKQLIETGPPFPVETFDKILLDAPCSALGQRPLLKNTSSVKTLKSYVPLQRKLFHSAVRLLKPSGILVYSTCTITQRECESMVSWALKTFPDITLVPAEPLQGKPGWKTNGLSDEQRYMIQRFCPDPNKFNECNIYCNNIGFFIAKFKKK